jgi:uncharacterized membrane protein YcaP (DUF421 family)
MDLGSIAVRALCTYLFLVLLLRLSGKRVIKEGASFDFVLALILGDMIDDAVWSEVPFAQFVVAASTLVLLKLLFTLPKLRQAARS